MSRSYFKGFSALSTASVAAVTLLLSASANAQVTTEVYDNYNDTGTDITFIDPAVGTLLTPDILFATNTGYNFHPFDLGTFGTESTSCISVAADGTYSFGLNSDDGSYLFIDGGLVVNNGGAHGPNTVFNATFLTAGVHDLRVPFFEDFGGPSGVDVYLPAGVSYVNCVPEPSAWAFGAMAGASVLGLVARRRKG